MVEPDFNETAGFDANLEAFTKQLEGEDAEFGTIFRNSVSELLAATDDSTRKSARIRFNAKVRASLDERDATETDSEPLQ
jgi:hypothetical protein